MGWAQRARLNEGNPTPPLQSSCVRSIDAKKHHELFRKKLAPSYATVRLSNRIYLIDKHGTLRRVSAASEKKLTETAAGGTEKVPANS